MTQEDVILTQEDVILSQEDVILSGADRDLLRSAESKDPDAFDSPTLLKYLGREIQDGRAGMVTFGLLRLRLPQQRGKLRSG